MKHKSLQIYFLLSPLKHTCNQNLMGNSETLFFISFGEAVLHVITQRDFLSWDRKFYLFDEPNDHYLICEL